MIGRSFDGLHFTPEEVPPQTLRRRSSSRYFVYGHRWEYSVSQSVRPSVCPFFSEEFKRQIREWGCCRLPQDNKNILCKFLLKGLNISVIGNVFEWICFGEEEREINESFHLGILIHWVFLMAFWEHLVLEILWQRKRGHAVAANTITGICYSCLMKFSKSCDGQWGESILPERIDWLTTTNPCASLHNNGIYKYSFKGYTHLWRSH